MAAVHSFIFGETPGFKIVPFKATHVKMNIFFHGAMEFFFFFFPANQNSPVCMKTADIKLFFYNFTVTLFCSRTLSLGIGNG